MYVNKQALYAQKLADDIINTYEKNTGDIIKSGSDLTKVVEFYKVNVEFQKLNMDCVDVYSIIIKDKDDYFKIIFDEDKAKDVKQSGIGSWNIFLGKMFGMLILNDDTYENIKEGTILYPNINKFQEYYEIKRNERIAMGEKKKNLLSKLDRIDSGSARREIINELSEIDEDLAVLKSLTKRKRYKVVSAKK